MIQFLRVLFLILFSPQAFSAYKVNLNWKAEPQFGGFYEAQRDGLFKKEKLDVQIIEGGSGTPTVQMLANGKTDFAVVSAEEIILLNSKNPKDKVLAIFASFQTNPQIIMSHKERGFKTLKDVFQSPGILALQSGLTYAQFLMKKYHPLKVKVVPYQGGVTHFLGDKSYSQQGFLTSEPLAAEKAGAKVTSFLVAEEGFNPYTTVVAVRESFYKKNQSDIEAFLKALRKGWEQYLLNPAPANEAMFQLNKSMDLETFRKGALAQASLVKDKKSLNFKIGSMTKERWELLSVQLKNLGLIPKVLPSESLFR